MSSPYGSCGSVDECTSNPCGDKKQIKYRHYYKCSPLESTVTCVTFGYPCDGKCSHCSDFMESEYLSCC